MIFSSQSDFHFEFPFRQGIHTMLPISWPVSVVLALFMTAIHIIYRIGTSPDYSPNFPMVSFNNAQLRRLPRIETIFN